MPAFKKNSHSLMLLGMFRGHFSNSSFPQNVFQKNLFRGVKLGAHCVKFLLRGIFSSKGQISIRVCFENPWSCLCTTQH